MHVTCQNCGRDSTIPDNSTPAKHYCVHCKRSAFVKSSKESNKAGQVIGAGAGAALGALGGPIGVVVGGLAGYLLGQAADENEQKGAPVVRKIFYSFHFDADNWRVGQVRNMGVIEENAAVSDHDWEAVKRGGDASIQSWIDSQMQNRECVVVLIGASTASRPWIDYEIKKAWNTNKGLLGINIHKLKDQMQSQSSKGPNPFSKFSVGGQNMAELVDVYDPPQVDSKDVYAYINQNIATWVESAIQRRG